MLLQRIRTSAVIIILLAAFGILATAENASAQLRVRFEDPSQPLLLPLTITDGGPGDLDPDPGSIAIFGITYGQFRIDQVAVLSKPAIGDATQAEVDVNAFVSSTLGGSLTITAADTGFTDPPEASLTLSTSVGGTITGASSTVSFDTWANPANVSPLNSAATTIPPGSAHVAMGPFGPNSYSATGNTSFARSGPYSIFKQARIVLTAGQSAGYDQSTLVNGLHSSTALTTSSVTPSTTVMAGTPVTITVSEKNTGETTITGVSVTGTGCSPWTSGLSTLAPNTSTTFSCMFTPTTTTNWTATGHGTDPAGNPVPGDGETTTGTITVFTASTSLTTKSVTPGTQVAPGTAVTITVTETNTGSSAISNVFVSGTGACTAYTPASVASLAAGASVDFSCTFTANNSDTWTATGHGTDIQNNPVSLSGETTSGSVTVIKASTTLTTKSVLPATTVAVGTPVTITVTETNTGNSTITNVNVTGTGACTAYSPASVASLAAGASVDFSCTFTATADASWSATGHGTDALNQPVSLENETTSGSIVVQQASTALNTKTVSPATNVISGTAVTITVTETNTGTSTITNVNVTGTGCTTWTPASVASLAAGASVDFSCTFTATSDTAWTATGHGTDAANNPVSLANETTGGEVTVFTASTTLTTKTVSPASNVISGTPVTITVTETNTGSSTISNVNVTGTGACTAYTPASVANLAAGASVDFSCTFTATANTSWTATGHGTDVSGNPVSLAGETTSGEVTVFTASTTLTTKSVSPAPNVIAGTPVTITVTETNTGNSVITNVNVTGTGACTAYTPASVASLAAGASVDFSCTFTATANTSWTATGHGTDAANNPVSLAGETTSGEVTVFTASTSLTTKTVSPASNVIAGTPVTITVTETNTGNSAITNVNVTGTGACTAYTPASVASLAAGASVDFSCTFTATANTSWTATGHGTDAANNPVSLAGETTSGTVTVFTASTSLTTKTVSPASNVIAGTPVTITVTEANTGNSAITNVNVTGTGACTAYTPASVASLAAGASVDFSCTFTATANTSWTATGHGTDVSGNAVSLDNETTSGTVTVFTASTTLTTKTVSPASNVIAGTPVTITVTEANTGNSTITNVNVTGTGACTAYTPASVASLAAGASVDFSCTFTATANTSWTATGHGTDVSGNAVSLAGETTSGEVTVFTASTTLTTKTVSPASNVIAGTPVTITVKETNTGNSAITNVNVTGTGACTAYTPASVASLAAGASVDFSCTFTATANTSWTATGHGTDVSGNAVSPAGETTSGTVTVFTASTSLTTKTVSPGTTVIAGTPVTLTVTEKNTGNSTITNVNVTGTGCTAWTPASVASLAAGASVDFSCTFTPSTTTAWTATGHGKDVVGNDVSLAGETTGGTVTVFTASTNLTTKTVSPSTSIISGTAVTITVTEKNTGNSTITNVYVTGTGCTTWTPASVASLAAGASVDFSCTFTPSTTTNWTATGHGKDILGNDVSLAGETTSGTVTVTPPPPAFCSYTPGGWGAPPNGGNVASIMYANFGAVYSNGVVVGIRTQSATAPYSFSSTANYYLKFSGPSAITTFLPNGGTPGVLSKNATDPPPGNGTWGGEFGSQVLALQLNVNFSAAGKIKPGFSTLKVTSGPLVGLTTAQVLALANQALGGKTSVLTPYNITVAQLTTILSSVNQSYDGCLVSTGYLAP